MMAKQAIEGHPEGLLAEHLPPLTAQEALVEANRCLFCYDAPCTHACPTHIDIPRFIKKIATDNLIGSARTIFESNLLGATCARVCPVQELCEGACVLGAEHKPIMIGRLQRYAMDYAYGRGIERYESRAGNRAESRGGRRRTGGPFLRGRIGPARSRRNGIREAQLAGGLSTYGIIALREPIEASLAEVQMIERLGVRIETGVELGSDLSARRSASALRRCISGPRPGRDAGLGIAGEEHDGRWPRVHRAKQAERAVQ